jgi:hypothetical protein
VTVTGSTTISGLLFADGLVFSSFIITGLQKATDPVTKYCRELNFKCNLNKTKRFVFKEGSKLTKAKRWTDCEQSRN